MCRAFLYRHLLTAGVGIIPGNFHALHPAASVVHRHSSKSFVSTSRSTVSRVSVMKYRVCHQGLLPGREATFHGGVSRRESFLTSLSVSPFDVSRMGLHRSCTLRACLHWNLWYFSGSLQDFIVIHHSLYRNSSILLFCIRSVSRVRTFVSTQVFLPSGSSSRLEYKLATLEHSFSS